MRHKELLPNEIHERLSTLGLMFETCPEVVFAYLFGGLVRGRSPTFSDVDVAVYVEETCDPVETKLALVKRITSHLVTDEVDVVVLNEASTALAGRILRNRRVIYDRDPFRRHAFESLRLREFLDFCVFEHRLLSRRYANG